MWNVSFLIWFIFFFFCGYTTRSSLVYLEDRWAEKAPKGSNCAKPEDNDVIYHSCLDGPYPRNRTKCRCSINYHEFIYLVCGYSSSEYSYWVKDANKSHCTDELNSKTHPVNIGPAPSVLSGQCNKPTEKGYLFHSCDKSGYSKSSTECYCSNNYPKKVNLKCSHNEWYTGNWENQCRGDKKETKAIVRLDYFRTRSWGTCKKPDEHLNYFHSCVNKNYSTNDTSCLCTSDNTKKINLICDNSVWYREGPQEPCTSSVVLLPNEVRCYKDTTSNKVQCNCLKNCFPLDMEKSLTHQKIFETCYNNGPIIQSPDEDNSLIMYYDNQTKTVTFNCSFGINYREEQLSCQNGILNPSMPKCELVKDIYCKEETNCYCRSNCFQLNLTEELNFEQIPFLCQKTNIIQHFQDKHLISVFDNSTGNLSFICDGDDYDLTGNNKLTCINGNLSGGILPTCSARSKSKIEEIRNLINDLVLYKTFTYSLAGLSILIFLIFTLSLVCLFCHQKTKLPQYLEQKANNPRVEGRNDQEYEEIDERRIETGVGVTNDYIIEQEYEEIDETQRGNANNTEQEYEEIDELRSRLERSTEVLDEDAEYGNVDEFKYITVKRNVDEVEERNLEYGTTGALFTKPLLIEGVEENNALYGTTNKQTTYNEVEEQNPTYGINVDSINKFKKPNLTDAVEVQNALYGKINEARRTIEKPSNMAEEHNALYGKSDEFRCKIEQSVLNGAVEHNVVYGKMIGELNTNRNENKGAVGANHTYEEIDELRNETQATNNTDNADTMYEHIDEFRNETQATNNSDNEDTMYEDIDEFRNNISTKTKTNAVLKKVPMHDAINGFRNNIQIQTNKCEDDSDVESEYENMDDDEDDDDYMNVSFRTSVKQPSPNYINL